MMSEPAFSIIVRTCNRPEFLPHCLASIARQEFRDFEVVLVNDGGAPVHRELPVPVTYIQHDERRGRPQALNSGLRAARGRYLTFLDDDDRYLPQHLRTVATALDGGAQVAYTDTIAVYEGRRTAGCVRDFWRPLLYFENWISPSHLALTRQAADATGEFDEGLLALEDWDYVIRLAERFPLVHLPVATVEMYVHGGNVTGTSFMDQYRPKLDAKYAAQRREQLRLGRLPGNLAGFLRIRAKAKLRRAALNRQLTAGHGKGPG